MEISIHQLLSSYCQELNESWVKHTTRIVDNQVSYESLRPFIEKFREAEQDGYDFQLVYCPFELLDKSHPGAHFEEKMVEWSVFRLKKFFYNSSLLYDGKCRS